MWVSVEAMHKYNVDLASAYWCMYLSKPIASDFWDARGCLECVSKMYGTDGTEVSGGNQVLTIITIQLDG